MAQKGDPGPLSGLQYPNTVTEVGTSCTAATCTADVTVTCATSGTKAIGGGLVNYMPAVSIIGSFPGTPSKVGESSAWTVRLSITDKTSHTVTAYAVCANAS
jgi:hypothetical protein